MENTTQNTPTLTLNDLNDARIVIEIAVSRGAFKAEESSIVGKIYDKLKSWLDVVAKQQEQAQSQESIPNEETTTPTEEPARSKKPAAKKSTAVKQKGKK